MDLSWSLNVLVCIMNIRISHSKQVREKRSSNIVVPMNNRCTQQREGATRDHAILARTRDYRVGTDALERCCCRATIATDSNQRLRVGSVACVHQKTDTK